MDNWLQLLDDAGGSMLGWTLWMNLWCGAILIAALAADRVLAHRVAPAWRMALFAAVLLRLALPVSLASPIGLSAASAPGMRVTLGADGDLTAAVGASGSKALAPADATAITPARFSWLQLVPLAYALGIGTLAAAWFISARRMQRIVREANPSGTTLDANASAPVLRHDEAGPILIGTFRPRLVIPADLENRAGSSGLSWVLRHEAAHVARRDPLLAAVLHGVVILAWPIAAAWLAASKIRSLMEQACDDRALRGAALQDREEYGRTLIELAANRSAWRFAPALPFGASLRSRVRAIAATHRWPAAVQVALALGLSIVLVACTGSRGAPQTLSDQNVQLDNAESEPFKGSLPIRITILRSWPAHPKLDFKLGQVQAGTPEPDWSIDRVLTREEFAEILAGATAANPDAVLSRPRLEVIPGSPATIRVGDDRSAFSLASTVTQVMIPAGQTARIYTMDLDFDRTGDDKTASSARVRGVKVPQGETVALLATGRIGGERLLVCITPGPDVVTTTFGADGSAVAGAANTRPLIKFAAKIHRVDAPTDYGSPKGDGPRQKWSAYPGGRAMTPQEFATYLTELRGRDGYALLAAPQVWVYPDQEAMIELEPEPQSPEARHTIRLRGAPDGNLVRFTGSYARTDAGMTSEGSWNQPRGFAPDGGMVWSIHDPVHGAWYTVTVQAEAHAPGSIKPQTFSTIATPK